MHLTRDGHSDALWFLLNIHPSTLKICGKVTRRIGYIPTKNCYNLLHGAASYNIFVIDKHGGTDSSVACTAFYRYQLLLLTVTNINYDVNLFIHKYISYAGVSSESLITTLKLIGNLFLLNEFWFAEWLKDKHLFIYLFIYCLWND